MNFVREMMENVVPISSFNKGIAGKIFGEVKRSGIKVVMKNNVPECVLISPEDYIKLIDQVNDAKLLALAAERMKDYSKEKVITSEEFDEQFGFSPEDVKDFEEVYEIAAKRIEKNIHLHD